jgi:hypothetical protein
MPIHDWTRVDAGLFHAFHQHWISALCNALNAGRLPANYFAIPEQVIAGPIPDVVTLEFLGAEKPSDGAASLALAAEPRRTKFVYRAELDRYAKKADQIAIRHPHGDVVAVIEIVSPGNKASRHMILTFVQKAVTLIRQGIHLLIVDLFPPGRRDPNGLHKLIWDEIQEEDFKLPPDKPLTLVSYDAGPTTVANVEPVAVGDPLPDMPLFLRPENAVAAPLEDSYQASWSVFPAPLKKLLETPAR